MNVELDIHHCEQVVTNTLMNYIFIERSVTLGRYKHVVFHELNYTSS